MHALMKLYTNMYMYKLLLSYTFENIQRCITDNHQQIHQYRFHLTRSDIKEDLYDLHDASVTLLYRDCDDS
jgi:hypothetical protein